MQETVRHLKDETEKMEEKLKGYEIIAKAIESRNKTLDKENKDKMCIIRWLLLLLVVSITGNAFAISWLIETDYVEETTTYETTTYSTDMGGAYNFYDSNGNLITSDLSLDEMQELIDINNGRD